MTSRKCPAIFNPGRFINRQKTEFLVSIENDFLRRNQGSTNPKPGPRFETTEGISKSGKFLKKNYLKFISEIKPAFGTRTNNVVMFVKNYDYGLAIIDLECTGLDKVSFKTSNLSLVKTNISLG